MKTKINIIIAILGIVMNCNSSFSQIENITINKQIVIEKIYAGVLSSTNFSMDSIHVSPSLNLRVGAVATWKPVRCLQYQD